MLVVDKFYWEFKGEDGEASYNLSMQDSNFRDINSIKNRIRRACKALFGKPIYHNDIYVENEDDMLKFIGDLTELIETGKN